jgi:hypothetical protein
MASEPASGEARVTAASVVSPLAGYPEMMDDLESHFWDARGRFPHIRPTRGGAPAVGEVLAKDSRPSFWQMASYANVLYWDFKFTRSRAARAKLEAQWRFIGMFWTHRQLGSAAPASGTMNASDDAAWVLNYLLQVHEVTGDREALADAEALLPSILDRWADPATARAPYGKLRASPDGILYVTADGDPQHQHVSTVFESMIANAALELHARTGDPDDLAYARATFDWTRRRLRQAASGLYFIELDLAPRLANGSANPHYLKPIGDYFGPAIRGLDATYLAGTMSMGVLSARLYRITGEAAYLDEARSTAAAMVGKMGYLRPGDRLVNSRDPWTDGYWAPAYAREVLTLPGVDPSGSLARAMVGTAAAILAQRTPQGYYGADWTGPETNPVDGATTWIEEAGLRTGSGAGQALPRQIMTSANSASMVQGGVAVDARSRLGKTAKSRAGP